MEALNLHQLLSRFDEHWSPTSIATLNDYEVKLVKVAGEFVWHAHDDTDELFLVISRRLTFQLRPRRRPRAGGAVRGPEERRARSPRGGRDLGAAARTTRRGQHWRRWRRAHRNRRRPQLSR